LQGGGKKKTKKPIPAAGKGGVGGGGQGVSPGKGGGGAPQIFIKFFPELFGHLRFCACLFLRGLLGLV